MLENLIARKKNILLVLKENSELFSKKITFDEIAYPQNKIDSLDWEAIEKLFHQVNKNITEKKAENLGLIVEHSGKLCPSFGGIILFGLNKSKLFPDAKFRCVRFLGNNKTNVFGLFLNNPLV